MKKVTIKGQLIRIIYQSTSSNSDLHPDFCIAVIRTENLFMGGKECKIKGNFNIKPRCRYEFEGYIAEHPQYGFSLQVTYYNTLLPNTRSGWLDYFIRLDFTSQEADAILKKYGTHNLLDQIIKDKKAFLAIRDISKMKKEGFLKSIETDDILKKIKKTLRKNDVSISFIDELEVTQKNPTMIAEVIKNRIYNLCPHIIRDFKTADQIYLIFNPTHQDDLYRIAWHIHNQLTIICNSHQHTSVKYQTLLKTLESFMDIPIGWTKELIYDGFGEALKLNLIVYNKDDDSVALALLNKAAQFITENLNNYAGNNPLFDEEFQNINIKQNSNKSITLDVTQAKAVSMALCSNVSVITGGPGTGKTVIIKAISQIIKRKFPRLKVQLAAPTGKAVNVLKTKTLDSSAQTLHSIIHWDPKINPSRFLNKDLQQSDADILIIDEMSMIDSWLLASVLNVCRSLQAIVFVGDVDQLQSIQPGNCLADIIASRRFPVTYLKQIYRQTKDNEIRILAEQIRTNNYHQALALGRDVVQYELDDAKSICEQVLILHQELLSKGYNYFHDIQVITPMYKGESGIIKLNNDLQKQTNNVQNKTGYQSPYNKNINFYLDDKVINVENDPDRNVFNGDIGRIIKCRPGKTGSDWVMQVAYPRNYGSINVVKYNREQMRSLQLAYAISVHKVQGSEVQNIIFALHKQQKYILTKELLYTAITRAQNLLYIVGARSLIEYAALRPSPYRKTMLKNLLIKDNKKYKKKEIK